MIREENKTRTSACIIQITSNNEYHSKGHVTLATNIDTTSNFVYRELKNLGDEDLEGRGGRVWGGGVLLPS